MLMLAGATWWLVQDHVAWIAVRSFGRDPKADTKDVLGRSLSADGDRVVVPEGDRAGVFELGSGRRVSATAAGPWVRSVLLSPDGRRLVTELDDYSFRLTDAGTGAEIRKFWRGVPAGAEFTGDSARLLVWKGGQADGAWMYEASDGRFVWGRGTYYPAPWATPIEEAVITADGAHVVIRHRQSPHTAVRITDGQEVAITRFYPQLEPVPLARQAQPGSRGGPLPTPLTGRGVIRLHTSRLASPNGVRYSEFEIGGGNVRADVYESAGARLIGHAILPELPLDARLLDDGSLIVVGYHQVQVYRARRPPTWWGWAWLPAAWAVAVAGAAVVGLGVRDVRRWYWPVFANERRAELESSEISGAVPGRDGRLDRVYSSALWQRS
jgi:hypothetical protein